MSGHRQRELHEIYAEMVVRTSSLQLWVLFGTAMHDWHLELDLEQEGLYREHFSFEDVTGYLEVKTSTNQVIRNQLALIAS